MLAQVIKLHYLFSESFRCFQSHPKSFSLTKKNKKKRSVFVHVPISDFVMLFSKFQNGTIQVHDFYLRERMAKHVLALIVQLAIAVIACY